MKTRKLILTGEIDDKTLSNFIPIFKTMDAKSGEIELIISSGGGSLDAGCGIYETMRTANNPITTVGMGMVGSMAVLLFEAGDIRLATEGTTFLLHDGSMTAKGNLMAVKGLMEEVLRSHHWYSQQIAERCKIPLKKVLELTSKESYMTAEEALKLKLLDAIIPYRKFAKIVKHKA